MIEGLEIILERMKSHPEEFVASSKWTKVIGTVIDFLTPEEMDVIEKGLHQAHRDWFRGAVMQTLAGEQARPTTSSATIASEDYYETLYGAIRNYRRRKQEEAIPQKMIPTPKVSPLAYQPTWTWKP